MVSSGLGLTEIAKQYPDSEAWALIGYHCEHAPWAGCALWDLIQPAFMFMVGVALPWSVANRRARGESFLCSFLHALWRSLLLVILAVFLTSNGASQTSWIFTNVLAQIGLGYPFLFLIALTRPRMQWLIAAALLVGYWLAFALYPVPPEDTNWQAVGVPKNWTHDEGFARHWEKNANAAAAFDVWFLNLFPRSAPFVFNAGGYQTLNFIPSLVTMIFGLLAGVLLRSKILMREKLQWLIVAGITGIVLGKGIELAGLCPIVKRIWTPSWALYSGGCVALMLAAFVAIIDGLGWQRWAFPFIIVGLNPVTIYCLWQLSSGFIRQQFQTHLGRNIFAYFGEPYTQLLQRGVVLAVLWLIAYWMYRRNIFVRI